MSRTTINPKTGRLLAGFPGGNLQLNMLGEVLSRKGVPVFKAGYSGSDRVLTYEGNRKYCQAVGKSLLSMTEQEVATHFKHNRLAYASDMTTEDVMRKFHQFGRYFLRLKYGFIEVGRLPAQQGSARFPVNPALLTPRTKDVRKTKS